MVKNTHLLNGHMLYLHIGIAYTTYVTEIKETYIEIYTKQVSCPLAIYSKLFIFYMTAISPNLIS